MILKVRNFFFFIWPRFLSSDWLIQLEAQNLGQMKWVEEGKFMPIEEAHRKWLCHVTSPSQEKRLIKREEAKSELPIYLVLTNLIAQMCNKSLTSCRHIWSKILLSYITQCQSPRTYGFLTPLMHRPWQQGEQPIIHRSIIDLVYSLVEV